MLRVLSRGQREDGSSSAAIPSILVYHTAVTALRINARGALNAEARSYLPASGDIDAAYAYQ